MLPAKQCSHCQREFVPVRKTQHHCSPACRAARKRPHAHDIRTAERAAASVAPTNFIGVDGEGITGPCECCSCPKFAGKVRCQTCKHHRDDHRHVYVLLGCGQEQIEDQAGLGWETIFEFLYAQSERHPRSAFVGFFLPYDFSQWLKTADPQKVWKLTTKRGQRTRSFVHNGRLRYRSVDFVGERGMWEVDVQGDQVLKFRPMACDCRFQAGVTCNHPKPPYMAVCDAGSFFQSTFLSVIDPENYPAGEAPCSAEEFELVKRGKDTRADADLDDDMRRYNRLENELLARVMSTLDAGFRSHDIKLRKTEWFGPGAASSQWLSQRMLPQDARPLTGNTAKAWDAARESYFGGWFEIFAHGTVPGVSYEYDISSAYPHAIRSLPCFDHGRWTAIKRGALLGALPDYALIYAQVRGLDPYMGAMLHRDKHHRINRPHATAGWFWSFEVEAAVRAGVVDEVKIEKGWAYEPCDCAPPLRAIEALYTDRLQVGKKTPRGKAAKLLMNSAYGKLAQSIGGHPWQHFPWASLITARTRTMILDAVASHPQGTRALLMVATDACYFASPHPGLPLSESLGDWEEKDKPDLTVFKPGVYWDADAKDDFKARGVSAKDLAPHKATIEVQFAELTWDIICRGPQTVRKDEWPTVSFPITFSMVSAKTAAVRGKPETAGKVSTRERNVQSGWPGTKRGQVYYDPDLGALRSRPVEGGGASVPYDKGSDMDEALISLLGFDPRQDEDRIEDFTPDGPVSGLLFGALGTGQFRNDVRWS